MAAHDHGVSRAHDGASVALLRRLRAGAEIPYVHRADVCSATPADLVANLMPAPGTDQTEDGYNSIWYFYCPKRFKNTKGEASGYRQRAIGAAGETRWHPEARAKAVDGSEGGTFCNCSYIRMKDGSLERLGWCMIEYDFVDKQAASADAAASNYVLCKVHRPLSRAKGRKPSSSSSSKSAATSSCSKRKRKAGNGNGDTEARPAKLIHTQSEQVQMQHDSSFTNDYPMPCYEQQHMDHAMFGHEEAHVLQQPHAAAPENYDGEFVQTVYGPISSQLAHINVDEWIGYQEMFGAEAVQGLQQPPCAEPEQGGEFIQIPCGLAEGTVEDMLGAETMPGEFVSMHPASTPLPLDDDFFVGVEPKCLFGAEEEVRTGASSGHAPVEAEITDEDLFGPEMMPGECVSMLTANTPLDDAQAPSWSMASSSSAGCSRLVQDPPLWRFPYLTCS